MAVGGLTTGQGKGNRITTKDMAQMFYRVEYSEKQKAFHHERYLSDREENTNGWWTIYECATNDEIQMFDIFLEHATGKKSGWTLETVLKYSQAWSAMHKELTRMNFTITKTTKP